MTQLSVKDELHRLIDALAPEEAEQFLDVVNNLLETDELTPEEEAAVQEGREPDCSRRVRDARRRRSRTRTLSYRSRAASGTDCARSPMTSPDPRHSAFLQGRTDGPPALKSGRDPHPVYVQDDVQVFDVTGIGPRGDIYRD